ncbi:MAG: hypothetical protein RLZZ531_1363 [Bacteroidota bacterium]|jgi:type IX secretion system PorP/SprF family membrane protein
MKSIFQIILIAMTFSGIAYGQQESHFTQFVDNQLFVNPAYAGSTGGLNATLMHREQWVGFSGSPRTSTFSLNTPLSYESVGVGLSFVNDRIGPLNQSMIYGDFSYSLRFSNTSKLSFGVKAGLNVISLNTSELTTTSGTDAALLQDARNQVNPNVGFGIYYHSKHWFFGASSPKLFQNSYDGTTLNLEKRHFFMNTGVVFNVSPSWKLRPVVQGKMTEGAPLSLDASLTAIYNEKLFFGTLYRYNAAAGVFVQFQATPAFRFGVGTEYGLTALRQYNYGTYELMLTYDISRMVTGVKSPRYF